MPLPLRVPAACFLACFSVSGCSTLRTWDSQHVIEQVADEITERLPKPPETETPLKDWVYIGGGLLAVGIHNWLDRRRYHKRHGGPGG